MTTTSQPTTTDEISEMYAVADDGEADTLDALRLRAGLTWDCTPAGEDFAHWTNLRTDDRCGQCGAPRPGTTPEAIPLGRDYELDPNGALADRAHGHQPARYVVVATVDADSPEQAIARVIWRSVAAGYGATVEAARLP